MAKKEIMPQAVALTDEIRELVVDYIKVRRAKRKMWKKDFIDDVGYSRTVIGNLSVARKRGCLNINTACALLDAIGYELRIVKKEDKAIVKYYKERQDG